MTSTSEKNIITHIVEQLYEKGKMHSRTMADFIPFKHKSIANKCLELESRALIERDDENIWSLRPGVTPQTLIDGTMQDDGGEPMVDQVSTATETQTKPTKEKEKVPLDQRDQFVSQLKAIGVTPKDAIPTIADIFFSGDIEDLHWLNDVLQRQAMGFVRADQRRLIVNWWANTRGLPISEDDFSFEREDEGKGKKATGKETKEEKPTMKPLDAGMGWKIGKDKDGDWVPLPGGPMSYQEAVEATERRHLISSYDTGAEEEDERGGGDGQEGKTTRRRQPAQESLFEKMMVKLIDKVFDDSRGGGSAESETVQRLTERIEQMERDKTEERFDKLEGMVAQIASRDPWEEYDRIEAMRSRLGIGTPAVTDQSPAVQLIKDTTDKMDRNVQRLVGVFERTVLKSEEFNPEETRTKQERESKATELLDEVSSRHRSRDLRKSAFGV